MIMSGSRKKNKNEWTSPSVTRHGDATQIIQQIDKYFGSSDGVVLNIPGQDDGIPIGSEPY
jgi:hypothetical protein